MKKKGNNTLLIAGGALVAFGIYKLYTILQKRKDRLEAEEQQPTDLAPAYTVPGTQAPSGGIQAAGFPLKKGQQNSYILKFQEAANLLKKSGKINIDRTLVEDGVFGSNTSAVARQILAYRWADYKDGVITKDQFWWAVSLPAQPSGGGTTSSSSAQPDSWITQSSYYQP